MENNKKKRKNKLLYFLTMLTILIVFLVIFLSGCYLKDKIFVDNLPKQPINNIRNVIKEDDDNKKNDGEIDFSYTYDKTYGNYIHLVNQFPISDEIGKKLEGAYKTFDFKLSFNEKALGVNYEITLNKLPISDLENDWVKVYLENEGKGLNNSYRNNGRVKTFNEYSKYNNRDNEIVLYKGTVTQSEVKRGYVNFTLRMWVSEDVKVVNKDYESKTIAAKVNVYASGKI